MTKSRAINEVANWPFKIGDTVVHPRHGVGEIVKFEDGEFQVGRVHKYYKIFISDRSTVWVPVDLSNSGLRKLASKNEISYCRQILKSNPVPLTLDSRIRQTGLMAHLKQGTIAAQCEAVRDLSAFVVIHKPAFDTTVAFLEALHRVLCEEWAVVEGISFVEAESEIDSLLEESRSTWRKKRHKSSSVSI